MDYAFFWSHNRGDYACFSQWYDSIFKDEEGRLFSNAEQYMMYQKAILMNDTDMAAIILEEQDPRKIKALGRRIKNFDAAVWDAHKQDVVYQGNLLKFTQHDKLRTILMNTKSKNIVEASPYDAIWGIGLTEVNARKVAPEDWPGQNLLGKMLMKVRTTLALENL
ncbi:hypothetical protein BC940DRAFT_290650 [Gongronella butleri]|nr:hypothetical protein BC940DRAFT_290650 [Gongronella butleri]